MASNFLCGRFEFDLKRPLVMGIVNVTPDSFSDGGAYFDPQAALHHAHALIAAGADILDIGGESTRPGSVGVDVDAEIARVIPVVRGLQDCGRALSVDTSKPEVMRAALDAGADMINDVYGFRQPGAIEAVRASQCGLCVMHMQGEPRTMQQAPHYDDLLGEVGAFLAARVQALGKAGIASARIVVDPGFGFGKTTSQNYALLRDLANLDTQGRPVLTGLSRKRMIGEVTGRDVNERTVGSVAAMLACVARGAAIVRVHDVTETVDALKIWQATQTGVHGERS